MSASAKPRLWQSTPFSSSSPSATLSSAHQSDSSPSPPPHTRVGGLYQAELPSLLSAAPSPESPAPAAAVKEEAAVEPALAKLSVLSLDGEALWQPSRAPDDATLDAYLESVQGLFQEQPDDFDEENALLLLHRCDYDASLALSLLQPRSSTVVDPSAAASSHSPPPPTQSPHSPQSSPSSPSTPDADTDDVCTICMDGGHLLICERRGCHRVYHPECAGLRSVPQGRWECPRHSCSACGEEWEEEGGNSRKRRRAERGSISAAELKGITGHASLISTHSHGHPHLLSPSSSAASSPTSGDSTPPTLTPHVECSACPTAYCLTHVPAAVLSAYGIAPSSLASLSLEALQAAVKGSAQGCFLCLSCMHVQERRNRLVMLRRLSEAMEGKGGESLWSEWEHRAATEEDADFTRLLHHPTEWQRIDDLLREANGAGARPSKGTGEKHEALAFSTLQTAQTGGGSKEAMQLE